MSRLSCLKIEKRVEGMMYKSVPKVQDICLFMSDECSQRCFFECYLIFFFFFSFGGKGEGFFGFVLSKNGNTVK